MDSSTPEQIQGAIRILKLRNNGLLLIFSSVPTFGIMIFFTRAELISFVIAILLLLIGAILLIEAASSKCPKCDKNFFGDWHFANGFTQKCMHCGLGAQYEQE